MTINAIDTMSFNDYVAATRRLLSRPSTATCAGAASCAALSRGLCNGDLSGRSFSELSAHYRARVVNDHNAVCFGKEERRQRRLFPGFNVIVNYNALARTDAQTIWNFYMARRGAFEAFYIYDLSLQNSHSWTQQGLYVFLANTLFTSCTGISR